MTFWPMSSCPDAPKSPPALKLAASLHLLNPLHSAMLRVKRNVVLSRREASLLPFLEDKQGVHCVMLSADSGESSLQAQGGARRLPAPPAAGQGLLLYSNEYRT